MTSEETNQQTGGSLVGSIGAAPHQQRDGEPAGAGRAGDGTGGSLVGPVVPAVPAVLAVPSVPAVPAVLDESGPGQPGEPPAGLAGAPPALTAQEWFARITRPADFVDFYHSYLRHRHPGIRIRSKLAYDLENSQECLGMIEVHGDDDEQLPKVALNWMVWHSDTQVDPSDSATTTITALKNSWWDYRRAAPYRDGTHWGPFVGAGAETESLLPAAPAAPAAEPPPAAAAGSLLDPGALVAAYRAEIQQQRPDYQPPERVTAADREEASRMLELLRGAGRLFEGAVKCWISSYVHQELGGGARLDCNTTMHALRRSWPNYRLLLPRAARPAVERPAGLRETVTKELQNNLSVPLKSAGVVVTANLLAESCGAGKAVERIRAKLAAARPDSLRSVYAATCVFEPERWPAGTLLADWRERFAGLWEKIDRTPPQDAGSRGGEALTAIAKAAAGSGDTMARSEPAAAV